MIEKYISWQKIDSAVYLCDERTDEYVFLNETAAYVFEGLINSVPLSEMSKELAARYGIDEEETYTDVKAVAISMIDMGIFAEGVSDNVTA